MAHRRYFTAVAALTAGGWLLGGCASTSGTSQSKTASNSTTAPVKKGVAAVAESSEVDPQAVSAHAHYAQGMLDDLSEDAEGALKEFTLAALADPSNETLVLDLSRRHLQANHPEQALEILQRATSLPNASGTLFGRLAQVYTVLGKDDPALAASQTAIKRAPLEVAGYLNAFIIDMKKGHPADALTILNQASKQTNAPVEFLVGVAELYANLEQKAPSLADAAKPGAAAVLQRAAQLNPSAPFLRLKLAEDFNLLGDTKSATKIYRDLLESHSELPALREEARARLADIYLRSSDPQQATEQLEAIVKDDPANAQAYYFLGTLALDAKKYPEAMDYYSKALLLHDDFKESESAYYTLTELQINLGQAKTAFQTLEKIRAKYHDNYRIQLLTAEAYSREKDFTNAVIHFTSAELMAKATKAGTLTEFFYFQMGAAYERKGDLEPAEQAFKKALELQPDFAEALNYYGYMLADRGEKLDEARGMIEKALKKEPKNVAFLDSMGWVLFKQKQPEAALPNLIMAVALSDEPDATLLDHLGDIYAALNKPDKAREAWRKSLQVEKNEQIQKKLENPPSE